MEFWQNNLTNTSWQILQKIRKKYQFVLIGGWAVWLYTGALKSRDIDIIVNYDELDKIKQDFEIFKNERLTKYEARSGEIDIDIYLPHYSKIGIPIEKIIKDTQIQEGFIVPTAEILFILKQIVAQNRQATPKGEKDRIDLISMMKADIINWSEWQTILEKYQLTNLKKQLILLMKTTYEVSELNLNPQQMSRLKKKVNSALTL